MRIYSKYKDYYDHVLPPSGSVGWYRKKEDFILDPTIKLAVSKEQTDFLNGSGNKMPAPVFSTRLDWQGHDRRYPDYFVLGFCGKLYPVYLIYSNEYTSKASCKAYLDIAEFMEEYNSTHRNKLKFENNKVWHDRYPFNAGGLIEWNREFNQEKKVLDVFVALKAPIFIIGNYYHNRNHDGLELRVNPELSKYGVQRLFDPWQAYQNIEMFLSNQLAVEMNEMPSFSDELKRDAHGFDNWSFKQKGPKLRKSK